MLSYSYNVAGHILYIVVKLDVGLWSDSDSHLRQMSEQLATHVIDPFDLHKLWEQMASESEQRIISGPTNYSTTKLHKIKLKIS